MTREEVLESIQARRYTVDLENNCCCKVVWYLNNGDLDCEIRSHKCWVGNVLRIDNQPIALKILDEKSISFIQDLDFECLEELEEIENFDYEAVHDCYKELNNNYYCDVNKSHEAKEKSSLIDFIIEGEYECFIYFPRNFSNEYTCILASKGVKRPEGAREITPEDFADYYCQVGDKVTQYYTSFQFIPKQKAQSIQTFF